MSSSAYLNDALGHLPEFDLGYSLNDRYHPTEVTVFEHGPEISTRWITVDLESAVSLERCR